MVAQHRVTRPDERSVHGRIANQQMLARHPFQRLAQGSAGPAIYRAPHRRKQGQRMALEPMADRLPIRIGAAHAGCVQEVGTLGRREKVQVQRP
jgi:hypothetical protein